MNQIFCINYINNVGDHKRRHIDLDKIVSITEPDDTKPFINFEIICQLVDDPIMFSSGGGPYFKSKMIETFNDVLNAWISWVEHKNVTTTSSNS